MTPGTRIRVNKHSAWPERVGCAGVVVDPAHFNGIYPADKPLRGEVIVLLDDDPLMSGESRARDWTCVMSTKSLDVERGRKSSIGDAVQDYFSAHPVSGGPGA